jgi:hypothetical protein
MARARKPFQETSIGRALLDAFGLSNDTSVDAMNEVLERKAAALALPALAQMMPATPCSYGLQITMPVRQEETQRQVIKFEEAVLLVCVGFEVSAAAEGVTPYAKSEVLARLDVRREREFFTSRSDSKSGSAPNGFVPVSILDFRAPRLFMRIIESADAELGVAIRSRYAGGFSLPCVVDVVALATPLDPTF